MPIWKRLNKTGEGQIDVNMDSVLHIEGHITHTILYFAASANNTIHTLWVKETPDQIHTMKPIHSNW